MASAGARAARALAPIARCAPMPLMPSSFCLRSCAVRGQIARGEAVSVGITTAQRTRENGGDTRGPQPSGFGVAATVMGVCVFGCRVVAAGGPTDNGVNTTQYARTQRTNGGGGGLGAGFVSEVRGSAGERGEAKERPRGSIGDWPARNGQINAHKSTETDRNETGGVFVFLLLMVGDQCGRGCGDVGFVW